MIGLLLVVSVIGVNPMSTPPIAPPIRVFPLSDELGGKDFIWQPIPSSNGKQWALMLKGQQVGAWDVVDRYYRPILSNGQWGFKSNQPPIAPPLSGLDVGQTSYNPSQTSYKPSYAIYNPYLDARSASYPFSGNVNSNTYNPVIPSVGSSYCPTGT